MSVFESKKTVGAIQCKSCQIAKEFNGYTMFCPTCIACGARIIQQIGTLPIPKSECSSRRSAMLAVWVKWGHDEGQIRDLVKGPLCIGPLSGPAKATGKDAHCPARPRSRGKR